MKSLAFLLTLSTVVAIPSQGGLPDPGPPYRTPGIDTNILQSYHLGQRPVPENLKSKLDHVFPPAPPPKEFNWKYITQHYPYHFDHDLNRPNHLGWWYKMDNAYCLHVRPGSRSPQPATGDYETASSYLPRNCTDFLHTAVGTQYGGNILNTISCGVLSGEANPADKVAFYADRNPVMDIEKNNFVEEGETKEFGTATAYVLGENWEYLEDCRAGCETCFDAMAEFGAEQAACRRRVGKSSCGAGLVFGKPPALDCTSSPLLPGVEGNCTLNKRAPRWAELGFESIREALDAGGAERADKGLGDVRVYYKSTLSTSDVGFGRYGPAGRREVLRAALATGERIDHLAPPKERVLNKTPLLYGDE